MLFSLSAFSVTCKLEIMDQAWPSDLFAARSEYLPEAVFYCDNYCESIVNIVHGPDKMWVESNLGCQEMPRHRPLLVKKNFSWHVSVLSISTQINTLTNIFRYPFDPRVNAVARKISLSFCQKCRLQLNTHTPYVCGFAWGDMMHGCLVYTELD